MKTTPQKAFNSVKAVSQFTLVTPLIKGSTLAGKIARRTFAKNKVLQISQKEEPVAQSLCLSNSAAFILNNSFIVNARARIPHSKDRRVPTAGTLRHLRQARE